MMRVKGLLRALSPGSRDPRRGGWMLIGLFMLTAPAYADKSPYDWALVRLDYARNEKVGQLRAFCDRIHALARTAARDQLLLACFDVNLKYAQATEQGPVPEALTARVSELRERFNRYYIEQYLAFYDILFVDVQGRVFYTVRKESDFHRNFFEPDAPAGALVSCLNGRPGSEAFVDFHEYGPSSEPAAFFVEPVKGENGLRGWIVLQCAINKLNTLFAWTEDLGDTGETFLVNREGFMLTESNFEGASTILSRRLDDRNIQAKFTEGRGHRTVTDYRGCTALTSFEVVEFLGTSWLVVAKVDTHEIITRHYADHRKYFGERLLAQIEDLPVPPLRDKPATPADVTSRRVDMDEFLRADRGQILHTFGVSTCTGLLVTYPGRFAYLAHISPKDKVYGAQDTNVVRQMIKRIQTFDIYPCDKRRLTCIVVATHLDSLLGITDKLIEEGMMLSQVHVIYNPQAKSASMRYDCAHDDLQVAWRTTDGSVNSGVHLAVDARNLETIARDIMGLTSTPAGTAASDDGARHLRERPAAVAASQ